MSTHITNTQVPRNRRRQANAFIFAWTGLTLLIGACVFIAIYFASGDPKLAEILAIADTATPVPPTATLVPTLPPATPVPTLAAGEGGGPEQVAPSTVGAPDAAEEPTPTLLPNRDMRFGYGIQVQENYDMQGYFYELVSDRLGLGWVKQQIRWSVLEPEKGKIDFSVLDLVVPAAEEHGLKLMLSVVTSPDWARPAGADLEGHGPPADYQDFANFLTAILERYPGRIHAIEVWNEMNLDREWSTPDGISAVDYVEMLGIAERAIHAVDPGVIVISGALSPTGGDGGVRSLDDFQYFDQLVDAGLLHYADCVGAHHNGYNIPPLAAYDDPAAMGEEAENFTGPWLNPHHSWSFRSTLEYYYSKILAAGGDQKLCVTEFGWATAEDLAGCPPSFQFALDNTLEEQAKWSVEAFEWLADWEGAWLAFLWNLNYSPMAAGDPQNDNVPYSILAGDGSPRPAFDAIANMPKD